MFFAKYMKIGRLSVRKVFVYNRPKAVKSENREVIWQMKLRNALIAAILVLALAGTAVAADTIKIGVYLPLTGRTAFGGQLELEGVQMGISWPVLPV
jgi:hypothetical protein